MELFNVLATVSRPAFLQLLADFVVVADNFDDLYTPDFMFVFPVWECYLVGTVGSEDVVSEGATVSWGLFLDVRMTRGSIRLSSARGCRG